MDWLRLWMMTHSPQLQTTWTGTLDRWAAEVEYGHVIATVRNIRDRKPDALIQASLSSSSFCNKIVHGYDVLY